jgi:hypothetical protein
VKPVSLARSMRSREGIKPPETLSISLEHKVVTSETP